MNQPSSTEPVVDIVITNHDYGRFLADALDSACRQTYPKVNVIAVDDGSTDDSREVLARYEDRVEIVLKERGGQASALNAGIERCTGDVLILLDADDILRPDAARLVADAFAADPELVKVQFRMAVIDAEGRLTGATKPTPHLRPPTGDVKVAELAYPFDLAWLPGGGTAFRTEVVRRIMPIPEADYPVCGADWYLVHLAALLGNAAALDDVCAEYRIHGDNGYELALSRLDLQHVRDSIVYARVTCASLERLADDLGLERPRPTLSPSDLANRMISLKLHPGLHPIERDSKAGLMRDAVRAVRRRSDAALPMKALFLLWFAAQAVLPRRLARRLAELFLFPDRRVPLNRMLGRMQEPDDPGAR